MAKPWLVYILNTLLKMYLYRRTSISIETTIQEGLLYSTEPVLQVCPRKLNLINDYGPPNNIWHDYDCLGLRI